MILCDSTLRLSRAYIYRIIRLLFETFNAYNMWGAFLPAAGNLLEYLC